VGPLLACAEGPLDAVRPVVGSVTWCLGAVQPARTTTPTDTRATARARAEGERTGDTLTNCPGRHTVNTRAWDAGTAADTDSRLAHREALQNPNIHRTDR